MSHSVTSNTQEKVSHTLVPLKSVGFRLVITKSPAPPSNALRFTYKTRDFKVIFPACMMQRLNRIHPAPFCSQNSFFSLSPAFGLCWKDLEGLFFLCEQEWELVCRGGRGERVEGEATGMKKRESVCEREGNEREQEVGYVGE